MIKSKIIKIEVKKEIPFPKLMTTEKGTVILATGTSDVGIIGTRIVSCKTEFKDALGNHSIGWGIDNFKDFNGSVIISNI